MIEKILSKIADIVDRVFKSGLAKELLHATWFPSAMLGILIVALFTVAQRGYIDTPKKNHELIQHNTDQLNSIQEELSTRKKKFERLEAEDVKIKAKIVELCPDKNAKAGPK